MYSEEDLIKEKEKKKQEEKRRRVNTFLGSDDTNAPIQEQEEEFYDDFFQYESDHKDFDIEEEPDLETKEKKESRGSLVIIVILLLVFAVLGILYTKTFNKKDTEEAIEKDPVVKIDEVSAEVNEGEEYQLKYSFDNFSDDPKTTFVSSDENIATVNNEGKVKGVKEGTVKIIMSYFIKEVSYQKEFSVVVKAVKKEEPKEEPKKEEPKTPAKDTTKPTLTVNVSNAKENTYVNHDVEISVSAKDDSGKVTAQYVFNCSSNCKYNNVSNGKITVSSDGTTVVTVLATDSSGNKTSKSVTIKIDKSKPTCTLKVASDGTLTANVADNLGLMEYYGFNSNYSGAKEKQKKISAAGAYSYFVKDTAGNTNSCSITVNSKTQYRSRTCDASHKTFSAWRVRKQVYITSCGKYTKYEAEKAYNTWYRTRSDADASKCNGSSPCYYCTAYARNVTGCNWGNEAWGAYQDAAIEESNTVQVEKAQIYY